MPSIPPARPIKAKGKIMSDDSLVDVAPRFLWAHTSPLLADPEWIAGFRWMIERLLSTARRMKHNMPSYRTALVVREWYPFLEGLSLHVMKAVNAGRNGPGIAAYVLDARVDEAFQLTCAMLDDMLDRKAANKNKVPIPLSTLEAINELLETMVVPDAPQASVGDPGEGTAKASPVDFAALAAELRKARKTRQATLVEYMADKPKATVDDVARDVHDNRHTSEKTIRENARQTNDSLANLGAQLSFRVMSGCLFREISPK